MIEKRMVLLMGSHLIWNHYVVLNTCESLGKSIKIADSGYVMLLLNLCFLKLVHWKAIYFS
jgi:hypothetical protein